MRIGTRASPLALAQATLVAGLLGNGEIVPIITAGDRDAGAQDKSRWVGELEQALRGGEIDLAVHSAKDLPVEPAPGLELACTPARAAVEDALCGAPSLAALPAGATVATSSLRRAAQLLAARSDLQIAAMRGNVETRLAKLERGAADAIVLARAGLQRLGREQAIGEVLDPVRFVPAPGQGTIAVQARREDGEVLGALAAIGDANTLAALSAERALAGALGASCQTPLGAHARVSAGSISLRAWVGLPDGSWWASDELAGPAAEPQALGRALAERLEAVGAQEILRQAQALAPGAA